MKQWRVRRACFHWKGDFTLAERRSTRSPPLSLRSYPSAFSFCLVSNRLNSFMSVYFKVFESNNPPPPLPSRMYVQETYVTEDISNIIQAGEDKDLTFNPWKHSTLKRHDMEEKTVTNHTHCDL